MIEEAGRLGGWNEEEERLATQQLIPELGFLDKHSGGSERD